MNVIAKGRSSSACLRVQVLPTQWAASTYRHDDDLIFGHPQKGSPLDPSKLSRDYMRPALKRAKITKPFRVRHD